MGDDVADERVTQVFARLVVSGEPVAVRALLGYFGVHAPLKRSPLAVHQRVTLLGRRGVDRKVCSAVGVSRCLVDRGVRFGRGAIEQVIDVVNSCPPAR